MSGEQREALRDGDAQRRLTALGIVGLLKRVDGGNGRERHPLAPVVERFHGRQFHGLLLSHLHRREIARHHGDQGGRDAHDAGNLDALTRHLLLAAMQQVPATHGAHKHGAHHPRGAHGVAKLMDGEGRERHLGEARHLIAHGVGVECASHGVLHPCVGHENPPCRDGGAKAGEPRGGEVEATRHLLPAEEHHGHEGALHEERHDALDGEWRAEYVAHKPRVVAPIGAKLKLEDEAGGHADGEVHAKQSLPEDGGVFPEGLARAVVARFHNAHDEGEAQRERHKQPVVDGGERKLRTRPIDERGVNGHEVCH